MGRRQRGYCMIDLIEKLSISIKRNILELAQSNAVCIDESVISPVLETPKEKNHGDFSTAAAMKLSKFFRKPPRDIANNLIDKFKSDNDISKLVKRIEIAGSGFINFFLSQDSILNILRCVIEKDTDYGSSNIRYNENIILEFVSANPTGPLNAVSARAAAVGDIQANILIKSGAKVHREFYINDVGNQVNLLGASVKARYDELFGKPAQIPDEGYQGDYIIDIAKKIADKHGDSLLESEDILFFAEFAMNHNVARQKIDLEKYGVIFDTWFSEKTIHDKNLLNECFNILLDKGFLYKQEEKWWFQSTAFGDDNDRVIIRENGIPTYFMADIAYHYHKYQRNFNKLIDIWGPDHHGYIARLKGAIQALGFPEDSFTVLIVQQVNLIKDGKPVKMSKRAGRFIMMEDVIDEVGKDAARFFFTMRTSDSQLDFDLDLAKKHTPDNPCFYVQYAHARIYSIYRKFEQEGGDIKSVNFNSADLSLLTSDEELNLIKKIGQFPQVIEICSRTLDIHHLPYYLYELSSVFHNYYNLGKENPQFRIVTGDKNKTYAKLALVEAVRIVIQEGLRILGVFAPQTM